MHNVTWYLFPYYNIKNSELYSMCIYIISMSQSTATIYLIPDYSNIEYVQTGHFHNGDLYEMISFKTVNGSVVNSNLVQHWLSSNGSLFSQ